MKKIIILVVFFLICSNINSQIKNHYSFIIFENNDTTNEAELYLFKKIGVFINNVNNDTIYKLKFMFEDMNIKHYIENEDLYILKRYYQGNYNPPYHNQLLLKYQIMSDTLVLANRFSFGHFPDSLPSKFEENKLTVFKGDSIIEFDLGKWQIVKRYVK